MHLGHKTVTVPFLLMDACSLRAVCWGGDAAMMGVHKLTAGDGYTYLLRQVAAADATHRGRPSLSDYYSAKGESPGTWFGRGLAGLEVPEARRYDPPAVKNEFTVEAGSQVTETQMKALFGLGMHPNAGKLMAELARFGAGDAEAEAAAALGSRFHVSAGDTELQRRLAEAYRDHNISNAPWDGPVDHELKATITTAIGREVFEDEYGRAPADDRELTGFIARNTRARSTSVAGYDLTFTPVKSVSVLWALAPTQVAEIIEACHDRAVTDALEWLQDEACFTRIGTDGIAQVDADGFIAARFTHRDSRAGDPNLHTHVAVSSKVRYTPASGHSRWLALDGRPLFQSNVAASELYNTRLERHVTAALGVQFTERGDADGGKREVREIVGIDPALIAAFSSRRAGIEVRTAELAKQFHIDHGREPTAVEAIALAQQATLETRTAKHEPRSLGEQRQEWQTQAVQVLGSPTAVRAVVEAAMTHREQDVPQITAAWIHTQAATVIEAVMAARSTWQRHHVFAEAQRLVRRAGADTGPRLAEQITDQALAEPHSITLTMDPGAELGEPLHLRRRDGSSVYRRHGIQLYTSLEMLAAEQRIVAAAQLSGGHTATTAAVDQALGEQAAGRALNTGQELLVRDMATSGRRVQLALAPAGAGKTTAMAALARAWEASGGTVLGLSPSASAAQLLRSEIDITVADTVDKFNWLADNPAQPGTHESARDWFDAINESTLLIVDEAGKAGTLALDAVIAVALERGACVRLIGDDRQLASISAGGVLRDIAETTDVITLSNIVRFASPAEAQAGAALRVGDPSGLSFYADHHRIHVASQATAADMAFAAWAGDRDAGRDSILLAPTNALVTDLNAKARQQRLEKQAAAHNSSDAAADLVREAALADGLQASVGDIIITKTNNRRLALGRTDFVRNGYRWKVIAVDNDGSLQAQHLDNNLVVALPADYVATSVRLGYATTIDAAQGATARYRCHTVGHDRLTRQQLYTALSRGVHENHIYLSTAEDDPHRILHTKATHPDTAIDVLTRALARDDAQISATTTERHAADPMRTLADNVARYTDALETAAENVLTEQGRRTLDTMADRIHPGLTDCDAWPVLRKHLALIGANNRNPLRRLSAVIARGGLDDAADPAAVIDWRLDPTGAHSGGTGPLPWLAAQPERVRADTEWSAYLDRRATLIAEQVAAVRDQAAAWTSETAPQWAQPLLGAAPGLVADIAVFRAATGTDPADTRITGPDQHSRRARRTQTELKKQAAATLGDLDQQTSHWHNLMDAIDPRLRADSYWPTLAHNLAIAARNGTDITDLITQAADAGPLPDEMPASALWWRITENPQIAADTGLDPNTFRHATELVQQRTARSGGRSRDAGHDLGL